jgi:hypothetical protein
MSLALAICYAAIAALLLNLNVASSWSFKVKAAAILLVTAFYGVTWYGIIGLEGWPTREQMPERFQLQWVAIDEPDASHDSDGAIYFWVRHFEAGGRGGEPRAYAIPYDDPSADAARDALALLQEGKRVEGRMTLQALEPNRDPDEEEAASEPAEIPAGGGPADLPAFEFREMPPPELPAKAPL